MLNLEELKHELNTQDVRATSHPLYIVYDKEQVPTTEDYANNDDYCFYNGSNNDEIAKGDLKRWYLDNFNDPNPEKVKAMSEEEVLNYLEECDFDIDKVFFVTKPKFKTVCLTQKGADAYIARHRHNLKDPYVYVDSAYGNQEMIDIQNYFKNYGKTLNDLRRENGLEPIPRIWGKQ